MDTKAHTVGSTTGDAARDREDAKSKARREAVLAECAGLLEKREQTKASQEEAFQRFVSLSLEDNTAVEDGEA